MTVEPESVSQRILRAATELLRKDGPQAASTRAVAAAAGVQPPDLYRLFGDKDRLIEQAVAEVQREFLHRKRRTLAPTDDPLQDFRRLWDVHVDFGLTHPEIYVLAYGHARTGRVSAASAEMTGLFEERLAGLARQGRLRVSVARSAGTVMVLIVGTVMMQLPLAKRNRDPRLSAAARTSAEAALVVPGAAVRTADAATNASVLRDALQGARRVPLSAAERALLKEWLDRLAAATD